MPVNAQNIKKAGKEKAVHIVLFKFKEGTTPEQIQSLKEEIFKQKGTISGLLDISFGEDFTGRAKGFTHAEVAVFKNRKYLEDFNTSEYHKQLIVTHIRPVLEDILVLDYEQKK
ncbi:MAG: Dabb family protein [Mangrovibacterium sp.]